MAESAADAGRAPAGRVPASRARAAARSAARLLAGQAALLAAQLGAVVFGLRWAIVDGAVSPVWPAAGIALAGVLWRGWAATPALFAGAWGGILLSGNGHPDWAAPLLAAAGTLAALGAGWCLRRAGFDPALLRQRDLLLLLTVGAGAGPLLAAGAGTAVLAAADLPEGRAAIVWLNWWIGDAIGVLVIAPALLAWTHGERPPARLGWWLHLGACVGATAVFLAALMSAQPPVLLRFWQGLPLLVWAALAFQVRGASLALALTAAASLWGAAVGRGPFGAGDSLGAAFDEPAMRYLLLQQFLAVVGGTTLLLAATASEQRAERRLREARQRYELALRGADLGTWDWDIEAGRLSYDERWAGMLGWRVEDLDPVPSTWGALIHPEDYARVRTLMRDYLAGRLPDFDARFRMRHRDGHWVHVLCRGRITRRGDDGRALRLTGTHLDVTALVEAERERDRLLASEQRARQEAERANRAKDEFLATLSHELRTPMGAILGWTHVLERSGGDDPALARRALEAVVRNARVQARLIDELLDVSRIESGRIALAIEPVELADVVEAATATVAPTAELQQVRLATELPRGVLVDGDRDRLQQVAWNLLANAIRHTPPGGLVRAALRVVSQPDGARMAELEVTDTGEGIAAEFLPQVFDRFSQSDTASRPRGGLGLGLSIVRGLVELHGGQVSAHSEGPGRGACFRVRLPLHVAAPGGAPKAA